MSVAAALLRAVVLCLVTNVALAAVWLVLSGDLPPVWVAIGASVFVVAYDRLVVQQSFDGRRD